ncbi:MAG: hypothetical protein JJU40_02020 [Rhodobacteraceae bacterium]|nr:hypothetical protein [Paracoccaceae bacterium]
MALFTFNGLSFVTEADVPISLAPTTLQVAAPDTTSRLSYTIPEDPEPGDIPLVALGGDPLAAIVGGAPLGRDHEAYIGQIVLDDGEGGTTWHEILIIERTFEDRVTMVEQTEHHLFLLGGDPLPVITDLAGLAAFNDAMLSAGAIETGPFVPGEPFALSSFASLAATSTDPQVIKAGWVDENPDTGNFEIGIGGWFGPPEGDGSVTILNGGQYDLITTGDTSSTFVLVGGWGSRGEVLISGAGSRMTVAAPGPSAENEAYVSVIFGVDDGAAGLAILNGGHFGMTNANPSTVDTTAELWLGQMFASLDMLMSAGTLNVDGFQRAQLTIAGDSTEVGARLENGSLFLVSASERTDFMMGVDDGIGRIDVTGGSLFRLEGLASATLGSSYLMSEGGRALIQVEGAGSRLELVAPGAADSTTDIAIGSVSGEGAIVLLDGAAMTISNPETGGSNTSVLSLRVGEGGGAGGIQMMNATLGIAGFATTNIAIGGEDDGTGALGLRNGSVMTIESGSPVTMDIGTAGTGLLEVSGGSTLDLGGGAVVRVGDWHDDPGMAMNSGEIQLVGTGSALTGVADIWIGLDPMDTGGMVTPTGMGRLTIGGGATLGDGDTAITLGLMGDILAGNGTLRGDVTMRGGDINLAFAGRETDGPTPLPARLDIEGDLTQAEGNSFIRLGYTPTGADLVAISGDLAITVGELRLLFDGSHVFYEYARGDTGTLITYDSFTLDPEAGIDLILSHSFLVPDFAYRFDITSTGPGAITFEALNDHDGGEAVLDFSGATESVGVFFDADAGIAGEINFAGGGSFMGVAVNVDEVRGTDGDDMIDFTGATRGVTLVGGAGNDTLRGGLGDDTFIIGAGNDMLDGGGGFDRAVFSGNRADYLIETDPITGATIVTDTRVGPMNEGVNTLIGINELVFLDESEIIAPSTYALSGQVVGRTGQGIEGATVTFTPAEGDAQGMTSGAGGLFDFTLDAGASGDLGASLAYDATAHPTITTASALNVLRLALGRALPTREATGEDFVAADFDGNGEVTSADAMEILRVALGRPTISGEAPRWVFLDADSDLTGLNRNDSTYTTGISVPEMGADISDLGLSGILVGYVPDTLAL